jgi:cerevisin
LLAPLSEVPRQPINNSYIVMLKKDVTQLDLLAHLDTVRDTHNLNPLEEGSFSGIRHVYDSYIKGYAGHFTESTVEALRRLPEVDYIEHDQVVRALDIGTQNSAPWGLARVSHREKLNFGTFRKYVFDESGGDGVDVYVIDTGVNVDHVEFQGRAKWGKTIPQNDNDVDANGHGTHCAGTIASRRYGVAKSANIIAVKVLGSNGSGSMSDVVAGVSWAAESAEATEKAAQQEFKQTGRRKHKGSVANMSLGGGASRALDQTVNGAVDGGLHFAVAAGNDNRDACDYSPAAAEKAVTVGASALSDERAYFSNYGKCVDVFAPGLNILSTWIGSDEATNIISGTSMASPHTAGMLAYLLSIYGSTTFQPNVPTAFDAPVMQDSTPSFTESIIAVAHDFLPSWISSYVPSPSLFVAEAAVAPIPKTLTPAQLKKALIALSTPDALTDVGKDSPNVLIFNNATTSSKLHDAQWWASL